MSSFENTAGPDLRKFLAVELAMSALCNGAINVGMAHLAFGGRSAVPLFGADGVAFDLVLTTFLTGLMMTLLLTPVLRRRVQRGSAPSLPRASVPGLLASLPRNTLLRGAAIGTIGLFAVVPAMVVGLFLLDVHAFTFSSVVIFKAGFGAMVGVAMTPAVIYPAIAR